jgi:membrane protease YdiL (CAAX protease family)
MRAFGWFLIAIVYTALAYILATHAARGLAPGDYFELADRSILLFLLLIGYSAMGRVGQAQRTPLRDMGLERRAGWQREFGLGAALGWGGIVACVLPTAAFGTLAIQLYRTPHQWLLLVIDFAVLAVAALGEEVIFRGYPFQRLIDALGPTLATLFAALLFGVFHLTNPNGSTASLTTTVISGWLLALAYLRTRALWVGWGLHLGWNASMGLLFGLPVSGLTIFSPVVSTYARGPVWVTGGGYGPEGSLTAMAVLFVLLFVLVRLTRELKHQYAGPVIIPAGIPVDIDALTRQQHERGIGPGASAAPPGQQLVQIIAPTPSQISLPVPPPTAENDPEAS